MKKTKDLTSRTLPTGLVHPSHTHDAMNEHVCE
jgi:hypothetical protein